ncbi:response regulator [Desulfuribacillus alkaliarsenatis]|uniref:DNA-binding response regulator n=1 Tax=Desulfuribacillus alkaliarsenatis TaxID=766136 RepID=A0A1E5G373_9FIRM|nr:response regulator transcription factor [Desulfuribacillus alkaliarsenatis]OEF97525.1 hypothetical protein BHF68_04785 [Desulfuribacillus alkaliarsenatis]
MIKVMVVDDQKLIRDGLKIMLNLEEDLEFVGEADNGKDALEVAKQCLPDVILMDIRMPKGDGVQGTKLIHQWNPSIKVLILTTFDDEEYVIEAIKVGGCGYLLKDIPSEELMDAIRTTYKGGSVLEPQITAKLLTHIQLQGYGQNGMLQGSLSKRQAPIDEGILTAREREILSLIGKGYSNQQLAQSLHITEGTAKNHVTNIMSKLDLHERSHLVIYALTGEKPNQ